MDSAARPPLPPLAKGGAASTRRSVGGGLDVDAAAFLVEVNRTFDQREDRVVAPQADILAGTPLGAALTDDDVSGDDALAAVLLDSQTLCARITTVAGRSLTLLMCHCSMCLSVCFQRR